MSAIGSDEGAADAHYEENARAIVKIHTRAFPGLNMDYQQTYPYIPDKYIYSENVQGSWTHSNDPGGAKDEVQCQDPSIAAPEVSDAVQASPATIDCPGLAEEKEGSDSLADYPTPAETLLTSPSKTPEPIPKPRFKPNTYFRCPFPDFDPSNVDLNRIGIVYEYRNDYFVVFEIPHLRGTPTAFRRHYVKRELVSGYLRYEWESLQKVGSKERGFGAATGKGSWAVYSKMIQQMRVGCAKAGEIVATKARDYKDQNGKEMVVGMYRDLSATSMGRVMAAVYVPVMTREGLEKKEAEKLFEEFIDFED